MSISSEISRITDARDDAFDAVAEKGVTVPSGSTIDDLPSLIRSIASSAGPYLTLGVADGVVENNGNLNSYTSPGVYQINSSYTISNKPSGAGAGIVRVWIANGQAPTSGGKWYYVLQAFIDIDGNEWRRRGNSTNTSTITWQSWRQLQFV